MSTFRAIVFSTLTAFALVSFQNCSPPASSVRTPNSSEILQNNGGTTTDNPKPSIDVSIMPHSVAAIGETQICVEDVKFKLVNSHGGSSISISMWIAAIRLASQLRGRNILVVKEGAYVDAFKIERGNFNLVELILDDDCAADHSLAVRNTYGSFGSKDRITLRFDGTSGGSGSLQLNMQPMLEALSRAQSAEDIGRLLQGVRGTFQ